MKTTTTIKQTLLALALTLSIVSCKKDKKDEPTPPPAAAQPIALTDLKALSTGASVKVPDAKKITGIVISDVSSKNIDSKTVVLQDAASQVGIIVTFDAAQTFVLGDQVEVDISGQTLAQVNGEIELTNVPAAKAKKTGTGTITAKTTTAADIATNKTVWDGTLVTIAATDLSGTTAKYSGTLTIKDASGTVTSAVLAGASFETTDLPASVSSVTGIVRTGGTDTRVDIRKTADVTNGAVTRLLTEDFTNITNPYDYGYGIDYGFTTAVGEWSGELFAAQTGRIWTSTEITGEANFTTPGRKYIYLAADDSANPSGLPNAFTNLVGLKTISVTWAQSEAKSYTILRPGNPIIGQFDPFDPSVDYTQIMIRVLVNSSTGAYLDVSTGISPKYTAAGKFNTYTFTVPTKEQLVAAGGDPLQLDAWLQNPVFGIFNLSKTKATGASAILFDKIVFGF